VTAYDPVISVVSTGVLHDVQATVTADQKYVTITGRESVSTLLGFQTYGFNTGTVQPGLGNGFVGTNQPNNNNVLNRQGMVRVDDN
jgi:hypothetical protein